MWETSANLWGLKLVISEIYICYLEKYKYAINNMSTNDAHLQLNKDELCFLCHLIEIITNLYNKIIVTIGNITNMKKKKKNSCFLHSKYYHGLKGLELKLYT